MEYYWKLYLNDGSTAKSHPYSDSKDSYPNETRLRMHRLLENRFILLENNQRLNMDYVFKTELVTDHKK